MTAATRAPHAAAEYALVADGSPGRDLAVSLVVYFPHLGQLESTLRSLADAARVALNAGVLRGVYVDLVDNGSDHPAAVDALLDDATGAEPRIRARVVRGHGNVGYGRGHNLSICERRSEFHLVLNPDVILREDALVEAVRFLDTHPDVGLLSPRVVGPDGSLQYLVRRRPSVGVLALRGFAPRALRGLFPNYLARYELRDRLGDGSAMVLDVPCATGCFMFMRGRAVRAVGGFDPRYFLYFEDHDLSLVLGRVARVAYVPRVRIQHFGGGAGRKGSRHVRMFIRSGWTFFNRHGWRII